MRMNAYKARQTCQPRHVKSRAPRHRMLLLVLAGDNYAVNWQVIACKETPGTN